VRTKTGGMTVVRCDNSGCVEKFLSASDPRIVEYQAIVAGWIKVLTKPKASDLHACPAHKKLHKAAEVKNPFDRSAGC
jgi:hypothetical protein